MKKTALANVLILLCILALIMTACRTEHLREDGESPNPIVSIELDDNAIEYELEAVEETEVLLDEVESLLQELEDLP